MHRYILAATLLLGAASLAAGQTGRTAKSLSVGDRAPAIDIAHWVKGEQIDELEEGKVYVVEFWATWCGPCRTSMPHLSELQQDHAEDVTIIGVSDEPLPTVVEFLTRTEGDELWFDKINYTLTTDPDESVKSDYFRAAGQRGIPTAFIVGRDGHVEWIGHPMTMDAPLEAVIAGEWDRRAFKEQFESRMQAQRQEHELSMKLSDARQNEDWQQVVDLLGQAVELDEERYGHLRVEQALVMIQHLDQHNRALRLLREQAEENWDDAMTLNMIAWTLVDDTEIDDKDVLRFAMKTAQRASKLTDDEDAATLDTLARVYYEMGELRDAIRWQKKAVDNAPAGPMKMQLQETLRRYEDER